MLSPLVFKAKYFASLPLQDLRVWDAWCRAQSPRPQGKVPYFWDPSQVRTYVPGVDCGCYLCMHVCVLFLRTCGCMCVCMRPFLCLSYPSWCCSFISCCGGSVFWSFSEEITSYIFVNLLYSWKRVSSGSSYANNLCFFK